MQVFADSRTGSSRRTWFTNILGVLTILLGALGSLFSFFALLLAIGKPYANSFDPLGIFLIFIVPPITLLAGAGLLLRQRWSRWWMILLMLGIVALGVKGLVAPTHKEPAYAPVPGPAADALSRSVAIQSAAGIAVGGLILLGLFSRGVRREFAGRKSEALPPPIPGEFPRGSHGGVGLENAKALPVIPAKPDGTIFPATFFLICAAIVTFWFAVQGINTGETRLPTRGAGNYVIARSEKPALFWTNIAVLGAIGTASCAAAGWLVLHRIRAVHR